MIATAAGTTEPTAVSTPVIANITHGISATRPPTAFTAACTSQSTVPLLLAIANRYVTPTRMMNRSPGKPAKIVSSSTASAVPTMNAAVMPSRPMLIGRSVPITKIATSTSIEVTW